MKWSSYAESVVETRQWEALLRRIQMGAVLLLASAYMPARVYVSNVGKFPHLERLALWIGVVWLFALVLYLVILRMTGKHWASLGAAASLAILVGSSGSVATRTSTPLAFIFVGILVIGFGVVLSKVSDNAQRIIVISMAIFVLAGPASDLLGTRSLDVHGWEAQPVRTEMPSELVQHPDIYLIILDGFPGDRALSEIYDYSIGGQSTSGVQSIEAWANYPVSLASVATLLEMDTLLEDGTIVAGETREALARIVAGSNRFVRKLSSEGYRTVHVESGWSRSYCDASIDICVSSHFLDEGTFEVLRQSVLGDLVERRFGSGFTAGAQSAMDWLTKNLPRLAANDQRDFVFATVLLPHPPLLLDDKCELVYADWRVGNSLYTYDEVVEYRTDAFLDQVACAARFQAHMLEVVPDDALIVFVSDHGGDSLGQLSKPAHEWSDEEVIERMNAHLSVRIPNSCELSDPSFLSNVLREVLFCLSNEEMPPSESPSIFIAERIAEPKILMMKELRVDQTRPLKIYLSS